MTTVNQERLEKEAQTTNRLDVIAHGTIREGSWRIQAARCRDDQADQGEKDTKTLRYDWFISSDGTSLRFSKPI